MLENSKNLCEKFKFVDTLILGKQRNYIQSVKNLLCYNVYYPTLPCEYNITQNPHYRKVNSPEFAPISQQFLQKLVIGILAGRWQNGHTPLYQTGISHSSSCERFDWLCLPVLLYRVVWKGATFLGIFPVFYIHSFMFITSNIASVADFWTVIWIFPGLYYGLRHFFCYSAGREDSPMPMWEKDE